MLGIEVALPILLAEHRIPKRYTCDGVDQPLPVRWRRVPTGTAELALFVVNLRSAPGKVFVDWAIAGLSPMLHGLSAGQLPRGAVVGRNSFGQVGYSVCPAKDAREEHIIVTVIALRRPLMVRPAFEAEEVYREAERGAKVIGLEGGIYTRL